VGALGQAWSEVSDVSDLSDVHGVLPVLEMVLSEPEAAAADLVVVDTGDHASGPHPRRVGPARRSRRATAARAVSTVRELVALVRGEHIDVPDEVSPWGGGESVGRRPSWAAIR